MIARRPKAALFLVIAMILLTMMVDKSVSVWVASWPQDGVARDFWGWLTDFGKSGVYFAVSAAIAVVAWLAARGAEIAARAARYRHVARQAAMAFCALAASGIAVNLLKPIFGRMRPRMLHGDAGLYGFEWFRLGSDFGSFPSGHAATLATVAVLGGWFLPRWRWVIWAACGVAAFSRIFVNAHYLSDVLAGLLLGVLVTLWVRQRFESRPQPFA